jgi:hypothetical protein
VARIIEVIETQDRRGLGRDNDPIRLVYQLWTKDGVLIFERDDWKTHQEAKA